MMIKYAILVLLFAPLVTAIVNRGCVRVSNIVHIIAIFGMGLSFSISAFLFYNTMGFAGGGGSGGQTYLFHYYTLVSFADFSLNFSVYVDQLTTVMLLVVTFVSLMVHIYSVGYMSSYKGFARYYSYISFFTFAMMLLLLAENFLVLFVGWELVGFSSYLLIGFFRDRYRAGLAASKAFLINRFADLGLYIAIVLMVVLTGSLSYSDTVLNASALSKLSSMPFLGGLSYLDLIAFLILLSAVGKSAQFPLHTWLLDAMEGPAPISALIHAATMVTAGVYIIARSYPMFMLSDTVSIVIVVLAVVTAFVGATSALFCRDIKRILAFSTMSQLGYMFMALGTGYYSIAIFHLFTHAFFKALLFLSAGVVAKTLHDQLDITKMGGLLRRMPITGATFFIGALAIAGIPPLAGFFSKDLIVVTLFEGAPAVFAWVSLFTAFLTSVYMFRLFFMVFMGKPRDAKLHSMAEERSKTMGLVLIVLAFFSAVVGLLGYSPTSGFFFVEMLQNVFPLHHNLHHDGGSVLEGTGWVAPVSIAIVVLGGLLSAYLYRGDLSRVSMLRNRFSPFTHLFVREWYVDTLLHKVIVPLFSYLSLVLRSIDAGIRGFSIFASITTRFFGFLFGSFQGRSISTYTIWFVLGNIVLLFFVVFWS